MGLPAGTTVTQAEFSSAVEAAQATMSIVRPGRATFDLQGEVVKPDSVDVKTSWTGFSKFVAVASCAVRESEDWLNAMLRDRHDLGAILACPCLSVTFFIQYGENCMALA